MAEKTELTWEQKAAALLNLSGWSEFALKMREDGTWYVHDAVEIRDRSCMIGVTVSAENPVMAILKHWLQLTQIEPHQYLVVKVCGKRRAVRWNGFMWADVAEPTP